MSGWQCEDKQWMQERRKQWREIQKKVNTLYYLNKEWKPAVKHFYLTGEDIDDHYCMKTLEIGPLIEMWFDPDTSVENWVKIKSKYNDRKWGTSKRRLREELNKLGELSETDDEGSFFNGLEERMYDFFFERGLKRENFPDMDDNEFKEHAWKCFWGIASSINENMRNNYFSPYNLVNFRLEEWRDAIVLAYDPERPEFGWTIERVDRAIGGSCQYTQEQVDLAHKVNVVLKDPALPKAARDYIQSLRSRPCHPNCFEFVK